VGSNETGRELDACGVAPERIHVTGIPVHPMFGKNFARERLRRALGVPVGRPLVLLLSGGIGVGRLDGLLRGLRALAGKVTFMASSAGHPALQRALETFRVRELTDLRIIGYVGNIHEYMAAADLLITKPGGLTVSEAMVLGLPLILVDPIPGQEILNACYLVGQGAALRADDAVTVREHVEALLQFPERRKALKARMAQVARPQAAREVARLLIARAGG
jgi:processive 1,2-diacylglycerol beta-glucosyltransferase